MSGEETCYERERRLAGEEREREQRRSEARRRLGNMGLELFPAMIAALDDPKNQAKGDDWREMAWTELEDLLAEECRELREEAMLGDYEAAIREAGDCLAVIAFMLDKCGERKEGEG